MRVAHRGISYELPLLLACGYYCRRAWFPLRRLMRAIKRALLSLRGWASTLLVFVPVCIVVFATLIHAGYLTLQNAVVEFVLITLGSFLLLAIKELRDSEAKRGEVLRKQWDYYCKWRYMLADALGDFYRHAGVIIKSYSFLDSLDSWNEAFCAVSVCNPRMEQLDSDLRKVIEITDTITSTAREIGFIDWNTEMANSQAQDMSRTMIGIVNAGHLAVDSYEAKDLGRSAVVLLGIVRRPWRYRNDMAHHELVQKYLDQHGAPIKA